MREWFELFVTFALLAAAVTVGVIAAHTLMYVFSFVFYLVTGF